MRVALSKRLYMKKIISLAVLISLAGCVTTTTNNPVLSDVHVEKCQELGRLIVTQDKEFQPSMSVSSLVLNQLPVVAEDFQDGVLTCSVAGVNDTGYAIAYDESSEIYLHRTFSGNNKTATLDSLTQQVALEQQRRQNLEREKREQEEAAKRQAAIDERIKFCLDFGAKYADILKGHGMRVDNVSVHDSWNSGDSITCVNSYDGYWVDDINEKGTEQVREQHVINKKTGEYQTIFR